MNPNLKTLPPEERMVIISHLEQIIKDCNLELSSLRAACFPHYYELSASKFRVTCIGCGENHLYRPGHDTLYRIDLPTIQKAPT